MVFSFIFFRPRNLKKTDHIDHILSSIQKEDENIVHSFNSMRTNQIQEMQALNYTIHSLTNTQIESNKAFQRLNGINHLMTLVNDLDNVVQM